MGWYRWQAHYGPGHMSRIVRYFWVEGELSDSERADYWEEFVRSEISHTSQASGDVEAVAELPEEERQRQIQRYTYAIEHAKEMLRVLGAAPAAGPT